MNAQYDLKTIGLLSLDNVIQPRAKEITKRNVIRMTVCRFFKHL